MAFDDSAPFPLEAKHLRVSPGWSTAVVEAGGGATVRNQWWSDGLRRYEFDLGVITLASYRLFEKHFNGRRGRTRGFPFLDRSCFVATNEAIGTGDGVTATFQLKRNDGDAANAYNREIYKVVALSEVVYVNAVAKTRTTHYTINNNTGVITFTGSNIPSVGQAITADYQHYVPVIYDMDSIEDADLFMWVDGGKQLVSVSGIRLRETRDIS